MIFSYCKIMSQKTKLKIILVQYDILSAFSN